jgi:hypothetical protein
VPFERLRRLRIFWAPSGGYFLKKGSQLLVIGEMFPSLRNFASANEPAPYAFTECLPNRRRRQLSAFQQIKNCSHRARNPRSINSSDVALKEISEMQDKHAGDLTISPETSRYSHVQLRWHYVRKIVKAQGSLMAVDSLGDLSPIPGPERPKHQVRALASREAGQPIDSPMLTNPVSRVNVVRVSVLRESRSFSLLGREEALLSFGYLVEPLGGLSSPFPHSTILQLI